MDTCVENELPEINRPSNTRTAHKNLRRRINKLLPQLRILTPEAVAVRWRIVDIMLRLLIKKVESGMDYRFAFLRPWEINKKIHKPTSVSGLIYKLVNFSPQILSTLDQTVKPPETQFSKNGILTMKEEVLVWNEIFNLTDEYDLLKPLTQVLSQRLNKIDGYIQGSCVNQAECK